jgi:RNA polymerase sigma-70 factor (ECF subfamily)
MMTTGMEQASTAAIWAQFSKRLRDFIARRVRKDNDVEDILQEVFAKIHAGLGGLKESEKLEAWLFQVARRAILDHFRRHSGKHRSSQLPEDLAEPTRAEDLTAEIASWLDPMMALLPEEDREALRLADLEGRSQRDLAAKLGISVAGAKSRVQRARKRLKDAVLDCCHIEMDRRGNAIDYAKKRRDCGPCSCD